MSELKMMKEFVLIVKYYEETCFDNEEIPLREVRYGPFYQIESLKTAERTIIEKLRSKGFVESLQSPFIYWKGNCKVILRKAERFLNIEEFQGGANE